MKTIDVDFLIPDIKQPNERTSFVSSLRENGFIYNIDRIDNVSHIVGEDNFEVEFLTPQKGDGRQYEGQRSGIGVIPQQLTHLQMLHQYSMDIKYGDFQLRVPQPEAYVIQKMVINSTRMPGKIIKDQEKIKGMLPYISREKIDEISHTLSKKEHKRYQAFLSDVLSIDNILDYGTSQAYNDLLDKFLSSDMPKTEIEKPLEKESPLTDSKQSKAREMESVRMDFFNRPKEERKKIKWEGTEYRISEFEDLYLAQCKKEGIEPCEEIKKHFYNICVDMHDYEPKHSPGDRLR